ncbi:MAG: hypothetical protein K5872_07955 [Rhizobiaceae bacterium]|nr:hypothetical protein [Rhizobiaceae bacterium]MCV0406147.1 hypothetical protein [Rhizobiaceae bacterium]
MTVSLRMRSDVTSENTSQEDLRKLVTKSPAAHRFQTLFGVGLEPFVGKIREVFVPPKAEGVDFEFAAGQRTAFLNLVDPSTAVGSIGPFTFESANKAVMVPDDPGASHSDRVWRRLASVASAGISYREPGLRESLHIAIRRDGANVHLDREGFVAQLDGKIRYDPKQVINHLSADLLSDFAPLLVSSLTVKDDSGQTKFQGTFAPWLEVNLPGSKRMDGSRRGGTEAIAGFRLFGIF